VLLTGSEEEGALIDHVTSRMRSSPIKVVGETGLLQLAALFTMCKVLITNSTGPMHLAASCEIPVIGIFCPIAGCSPQRWGPLGKNTRVLIPDVPVCQRCVGRRCEHYDCMNLIEPETVLREVQKLLMNLEEGEK
jgi:ADP-heptose:LPS heptosyltransferase